MIESLRTRLVRGGHRLLFRWRRDQLTRELADEIELHLEFKRAENSGIGPGPVAELSNRQMGNITLAKEDCRDMWSFMRIGSRRTCGMPSACTDERPCSPRSAYSL
jgi:hypothetical protein